MKSIKDIESIVRSYTSYNVEKVDFYDNSQYGTTPEHLKIKDLDGSWLIDVFVKDDSYVVGNANEHNSYYDFCADSAEMLKGMLTVLIGKHFKSEMIKKDRKIAQLEDELNPNAELY